MRFTILQRNHMCLCLLKPNIYYSNRNTRVSINTGSYKKIKKEIKFYQASSSEMYGGATREKLNEKSKLDPKSPYAVSKVFAHDMTKVYRDSYDLFCTNGILFNHESPIEVRLLLLEK